jgi:hypothetical protein
VEVKLSIQEMSEVKNQSLFSQDLTDSERGDIITQKPFYTTILIDIIDSGVGISKQGQ